MVTWPSIKERATGQAAPDRRRQSLVGSSDKRGPSSELLGKQGQALAKVAMKLTCRDSPHLGDQRGEGLFYREEARNTNEWTGALGFMRSSRAQGQELQQQKRCQKGTCGTNRIWQPQE